jgi:hypothetical protein
MPFVVPPDPERALPEDYLYEEGTGLELPGIEAKFEYGDAAKMVEDRIPGALLINDRSKPDQVRVSEISGLHDDPEVSDSRTERAGHYGERTGIIMPRGRTIGLTGHVRSGSVFRMRDLWRKLRGQFGREEKDFVIHPPYESPLIINELSTLVPAWQASLSVDNGSSLGGVGSLTDGTLQLLEPSVTVPGLVGTPTRMILSAATPIAWDRKDIWFKAIVGRGSQPSPPGDITLELQFVNYVGGVLTVQGNYTGFGAATITSPTVSTYYELKMRYTPTRLDYPDATHVIPRISMPVATTSGTYSFDVGRVALVKLDTGGLEPSGFFDSTLPGYELETASPTGRSIGPCYVANQAPDPDSTLDTAWGNASTSGATVDIDGSVIDWPEEDTSGTFWNIHNPSTTSRTLAIRSPATLSDPGLMVVAAGRSYRAHVRLLVYEMYTGGAFNIVWLNNAGAIISTSAVQGFAAVASGATAETYELEGIVVAPALAMRAYLQITGIAPSTTSGDKLQLVVSQPRFYDVSDYDPGSVALDSTMDPEHGVLTSSISRSGPTLIVSPDGARRRIPRPFLMRKVRALWDGKAPESQRNLQARRDFTMSLRASDPRIYAIDERRTIFRANVGATLASAQMSDFKALLDTPGAVRGLDAFTSGGSLNGRNAELGGVWATSGDAGDYSFSFVPAGGSPPADFQNGYTRLASSETNGRSAVLGSTNYINKQVDIMTQLFSAPSAGIITQGVLARYVDASNQLRAVVETAVGNTGTLRLRQIVSGTNTDAPTVAFTVPTMTVGSTGGVIVMRVRVIVYASGKAFAFVYNYGGTLLAQTTFTTTALATGGALATGKPGIIDFNSSGSGRVRAYDNFACISYAGDPYGPPTNFITDGSTLDPIVTWRTSKLGVTFPLNGVGLSAPDTAATTTYLSQDSLERMYSSTINSYVTPQVTVSGNAITSPGFDYDLMSGSFIGGAWHYNYIGALLKRVSASTWIEARFNSANKATMSGYHASPAPPNSLELWSSHNTSGGAGATKLAGWDIPVANLLDSTRKHLRTYMDGSNKVWVELWDRSPNFSDNGLITRQSFTLTASLISLYGAAIAGKPGMMARLARWDDGVHTGIDIDKMARNYGPPYLSSFESINYAASAFFLGCPVIGDVDDVPVKIVLRGDIDTPTIVLTNIDTGKTAALMLSGVFPEADPVTIDMDAGTIRSASGINYFARRAIGSRFFSFEPGLNVLTIQAAGWNTAAPAHVIASWRDALK